MIRLLPVMTRLFVTLIAIWPMLESVAAADDKIPVAELPEHTHIHGIAVDRSDPTRLFIATHHGFFVATADGMATRLSPIQDFMGFTPHPSDPVMFYASGHPAAGGNLGFLASSDGGATWTQVSPGLVGPVDFHQMDVSLIDPKTIYGAYGGIQVSRDGGRNWTMSGPEPEGLIALAASAEFVSRLYAATRIGLWMSNDDGKTWQEAGFGLDIVSMVRTEPGGTIFAFVVGRGLLQGGETNLTTSTVLNNGFGDRALVHFTVDPSDPNRMYGVTQNSEVVASTDGGHSWHSFGAN